MGMQAASVQPIVLKQVMLQIGSCSVTTNVEINTRHSTDDTLIGEIYTPKRFTLDTRRGPRTIYANLKAKHHKVQSLYMVGRRHP